MPNLRTFTVVIIAVVVAHYPLYAQKDMGAIAAIKVYAKQIDSWADNDSPLEPMVRDIAEIDRNIDFLPQTFA